ncbi:DNA polymerase III subunit delta [Terrilactibacillus laevilacticus]|uniref:DNA polymerase III subunit delta n=1 Tax=Terrilactibacillus laevilacticus TaxID=1380157 RepID=A0ABW5PTI1_9BACI|nr:DNA polymerase III subunit delta [Terrilactibacillus laevilacticus]
MPVTKKDLSIQKPLAPIYLLFGSQEYLIQHMKKTIVKEALSEEEMEVNLSSYDMLETSVEVGIEDAETLPFFGEKRVVILENAYFLTGSKPKVKVEHDLKRFETYLEHPSTDTVMIIPLFHEKLDKRKKIVKMIEKKGQIVELSQLGDRFIYDLLSSVASELGVRYTKEGHDQLMAFIGPNLMALANEVKKCAFYCYGTDQAIDQRVVLSLASRSLENNVFLLVDQVLANKRREALQLLSDLIKQKEDPIKLLALITRQIRIVYQVGVYQKDGYTQQNIASKIGIHPYSVKLASQQAKHFDLKRLEYVLTKCTETDYQMKTGGMDKRLALELFIHSTSKGA